MGNLHKSIQPMLEFLKVQFLVLYFFYLYTNNLPDDIICIIAIYANDATNSDQAYNLWQQLDLASALECDLWDTLDWGRKRLVAFNAQKTQLVPFGVSNNFGAIDVKMDGSVLKSALKMLGLTFSPKLDCGCYCL